MLGKGVKMITYGLTVSSAVGFFSASAVVLVSLDDPGFADSSVPPASVWIFPE